TTRPGIRAHSSTGPNWLRTVAKERKTEFDMPFAGIDRYGDLALLYGKQGEFSAIMRITNPVPRFGADPEGYTSFQHAMLGTIKILGEGHTVHKQDVFIRRRFRAPE